MGGQACILYGGAEFSRDTDVAILSTDANFKKLRYALDDLRAACIAVPPFLPEYLDRGHAVHFRCYRDDVKDMRLDVMSVMRKVDSFTALWKRRTTMEIPGIAVQLLSLPDLVIAKKTQRDKDWFMIKNLLDANYRQNRENPSEEQMNFWLKEMRTPELLCEIALENPSCLEENIAKRPLLKSALAGNISNLRTLLVEEENIEREKDRAYWLPLRKELEMLRRGV
jgi:hypothetical protein